VVVVGVGGGCWWWEFGLSDGLHFFNGYNLKGCLSRGFVVFVG